MENKKLERFFLLIHKHTVDYEKSIPEVFCLKGNELSKIWFDSEVIDNHVHWCMNIRYSKVISNQESLVLMFEEFLTTDSTTITSDFWLYNTIEEVTNSAGEYFQRIYRPTLYVNYSDLINTPDSVTERLSRKISNTKDYFPVDDMIMLSGVTQLSVIIENLKVICRTIHPTHDNLNVYGNEIRNLLILTCTEVEAQLVGIYRANLAIQRTSYSTKDYIALEPLLKLKDYSVLYNLYPWLDNFRPFKAWDTAKPTQSLPWYDAYNAVKHNREIEFKRANLGNLLEAIASLYILLNTQYGDYVPYWPDLMGNFFRLAERPSWRFYEYYLPPFKAKLWHSRPALMNRDPL